MRSSLQPLCDGALALGQLLHEAYVGVQAA